MDAGQPEVPQPLWTNPYPGHVAPGPRSLSICVCQHQSPLRSQGAAATPEMLQARRALFVAEFRELTNPEQQMPATPPPASTFSNWCQRVVNKLSLHQWADALDDTKTATAKIVLTGSEGTRYGGSHFPLTRDWQRHSFCRNVFANLVFYHWMLLGFDYSIPVFLQSLAFSKSGHDKDHRPREPASLTIEP